MKQKIRWITFIKLGIPIFLVFIFLGLNGIHDQQSPSDAIISLIKQLQQAEAERNFDKFASLHENSPEFCV